MIRIPLGSAVDNEALKDEKQRGEPGATEGAIEEETEFGMSTIFKRKKKPLDVIDIALLLPFDIPEEDETESVKTNKTSELFIEFYAGAKLAAMQLMEAGVDIRLHCFDTPKGLDEMAKILDKPEMRDMHLIVGPAYISQLPMLADFAKRNKIMTVLPFKVRDRAIYSNPYLIELNDNHDFWSEEANFTIDSWMNSGAIYVLDQDKIVDSKKRTLDYALLENKVRLHNEKFPETRVSLERVNIADLQLNKGQANKKAIFIIPSLSQAVVSSVIPQLHIKVKRSGLNAMLVGCPEWQAFSSLDLDMLHDLNLSFYTPLYVDYTADRTSVFLEQFRESFFTEPDAGYPYFGVYGYDIIQFFGNALSEHGKYFQEFLENCAYPQIGAQFRFRRPELWSGFVNTGFFHIRYTPDYEVEIIEEDFPVQMGR